METLTVESIKSLEKGKIYLIEVDPTPNMLESIPEWCTIARNLEIEFLFITKDFKVISPDGYVVLKNKDNNG